MLHVEHSGGSYGGCLITDQPFRRGQLIHRIDSSKLVRIPMYRTIQAGWAEHLDDLGKAAYLNHSCRPNTFVDTSARTVAALRDIEAGEILTYFYPATEWEMAQPFLCCCEAPECLRLIAGARFLSVDVLSRYRLNDHILRMVEGALRNTSGAIHPLRAASSSTS